MDANSQTQRSGSDSVNFQANQIILQSGITERDAKSIALQVYRENAMEFAAEAKQAAEDRAAALVDKVIETLAAKSSGLLAAFKDVDFQYSLFQAQQAQARSGEPDVESRLVSLLVERAASDPRSVKKLVYNEAITASPKLSQEHFDLLSLVMLFRSTTPRFRTLELVVDHLWRVAVPCAPAVTPKISLFQHLDYAACLRLLPLTNSTLGQICKNRSPGLFAKGFSEEHLKSVLPALALPSPLVGTSLNDKSLLQVMALDEQALPALMDKAGLSAADFEKVKKLLTAHLVGDELVEGIIVSKAAEMNLPLDAIDRIKRLFRAWNESGLVQAHLTSVGLVLGIANLQRKTGFRVEVGDWF